MTNNTIPTRWAISAFSMRRIYMIAALLTSLTLAIGCSDDSPVTPKPVHYNIYVSATDYLYLNGGKHNGFYVYDADSLTLIDSIPLSHIGGHAEISPDGRYLYSVLWRYKDPPHDYYLAKIDVSTGDMVWTKNNLNAQNLSPSLLDDGRLMLCGDLIIDAETGTVVRDHDYLTDEHWVLNDGPLHGTEVAAVHFDSVLYHDYSDTLAIAVDVMTGQQRGGFVARLGSGQPPLLIRAARLHPDGRRVLITGIRYDAQDAFFAVGDISTGELLLAARLSTSIAEIAISSDGTLAVVVDQANVAFGYGVPAVYVYDLVSYQHLKTFYDELVYLPGQVRFLPSDRRIAVFPDNGFASVGWLQTLDLTTMTREHAVDEPFPSPDVGGIAVGPRPSQ